MFRKFRFVTLALVAAAIAASSAQAKPVDPLAVSLLQAHGMSATQTYDWTQGTCSYQVKPASCYLTPQQAKLASRTLAESTGALKPISHERVGTRW